MIVRCVECVVVHLFIVFSFLLILWWLEFWVDFVVYCMCRWRWLVWGFYTMSGGCRCGVVRVEETMNLRRLKVVVVGTDGNGDDAASLVVK